MRDPHEFDEFYAEARERLLVQTFALTGDLPAARNAVRDAFVVSWHHWRKVSMVEDRESWIRPLAWSHALRRHTARLWHRDRDGGDSLRALLAALGGLPLVQRKALLLAHLAPVPLSQVARELGVPADEAERALQLATSRLSIELEVPSADLPTLFLPLTEVASRERWPRPGTIRRAGTARRRGHTVVGALGAVALVVATGAVVGDSQGAHPTLAREVERVEKQRVVAQETLPASALLTASQVGKLLSTGTWGGSKATDNRTGDGLRLPCQTSRYADPRGTASLFRGFASHPAPGAPGMAAFQAAEASVDVHAAAAAFGTMTGWFAGCSEGRAQLVATRRIDHVGDAATLIALRQWDEGATLVAAIARSGRFVTAVVTRTANVKSPGIDRAAELLSEAVGKLCTLPDAGACAGRPTTTVVAPVPTGAVSGMLAEIDLPPLAGIRLPWVGTDPERARHNVAASRCDRADFTVAGISHAMTRTFLIPGARLSDQFGLTETVGAMSLARAHSFVATVRSRVRACHAKELGTVANLIASESSREGDLYVWHLTTQISATRTVDYFMAILRAGTSVGQIGFVPTDAVRVRGTDVVTIARDALARLGDLRPPA